MAEADSFIFEPLDGRHIRDGFDCGEPSLDNYIRTQARQDARKKFSTTYVMVAQGAMNVLGYFSLSSSAVALRSLPPEYAKRLPQYPEVPATLLARLAVTKSHQGLGLGERLLLEALKRSLANTTVVASAAIVVDALHDRAAHFYNRYGFVPLQDEPLRLYLSMTAAKNLNL